VFYPEDERRDTRCPRTRSGERNCDQEDKNDGAVLLVAVLDAVTRALEEPRKEPLEDTVAVREEVGDASEQEEERRDGEEVPEDAECESPERRHPVEPDSQRYRTAEFEDRRGSEDHDDYFGRKE